LLKTPPKRKKIEELTKTFHWFFCDIVSSAYPSIPTTQQLKKIQKFYEILSKTTIMRTQDHNRIIIPTGDGYVIGFSDSSEKPLILAKNLLQKIEKYNKTKRGKERLYLRIGIDSGPVYVIKDVLTKKNAFWGPGIIMTKRVMDIGKENHILASKRIADDIRKLTKEYKLLFHPIGKYEIKHGEKIEIFNVYGKDFGNKIFPRKGKDMRRKDTDKDHQSTSNFKFKKMKININVTNPKTMMTHHTWIWDIVNVSGKSQNQVLFKLGGEVEKDISDLNIKITDASGNNLDIIRIDANKPFYKEFFVKLAKPVKPRYVVKGLKLEYDWEEPGREFIFELSTDCKTFSYKSTIPNSLNPKVRIFKRVGFSEKQSLEPTIKLGKKKTEILWKGKNLNAHN